MIDNGMVERGATQDRREREENEDYNLFVDPDYLFQTAAELIREQWDRIKEEKGRE